MVLTVRFVHPWVPVLASAMSPAWSYAMLLVLTTDAFFSVLVLRRSGDVELMGWGKLQKKLQKE